MKVLVTGGAGFIGSHIADALIARGHDVVVLDNFSSGRRANVPAGVTIVDCDIATKSFGVEADVVCHQAAQPSLRTSIEYPYLDAMVNIIGTLRVMKRAKRCGAHIVFASSSAVYDPAGGVFAEASPVMPNLPYGIAKAAAEQYLRASGVPHTILRYGNVYGPRQVPVGENQLIPHALAHITTGVPFAINGDGQQTRDFVYVGDIARANVLAIESRVSGTYNCGTGRGVAVNAVCAALRELCDWPGDWQHGPAKVGEARHVALASARAADALGWRAETDLMDGLQQTIQAWGRA